VWVLIGIVLGIIVGNFWPKTGLPSNRSVRHFVSLIKIVIAPVIFCTVVAGIASMESVKKVGRIGGKALLYFEAMTTVALVLGLLVMDLTKPGSGVNANPGKLQVSTAVGGFIKQGQSSHWYDFIFDISPVAWSVPSPRAISCRCSSSRSFSLSRSCTWVSAAGRSSRASSALGRLSSVELSRAPPEA